MSIELKRCLSIIRKWGWLLILSAAIASVLGLWTSWRAPQIYRATTTLLVGQYLKLDDPQGGDFSISQQLAASYAQMVPHQPILQATADALGLNVPWGSLAVNVNAVPAPGSSLIQITFADIDSTRAVLIVNEIGRQLVIQSPTPQDKRDERQIRFAEDQSQDLQNKISNAERQIEDLQNQLDLETSALRVGDIQRQITLLQERMTTWQGTYARMSQLSRGSRTNYLSVLEPASFAIPVSSNMPLNILLAATVGLLLAAGAAFLIEYLDDRLSIPEEASRILGLPIIGSIGRNDVGGNPADSLISLAVPDSPVSDDYRILRTNVQFACRKDAHLTILVTSPGDQEGRSVIAANLAASFAQMGRRTVLVDADLRQPGIHEMFNVSNDAGLTSLFSEEPGEISNQFPETTTSLVCLEGEKQEIKLKGRVTSHMVFAGIPGLQFLPSGRQLTNPADLLASPRMEQLLNILQSLGDVVVLDSPSLLTVADAGILATKVTGVLLVVENGKTRAPAALRAKNILSQADAHVLGVVFNRASKPINSKQGEGAKPNQNALPRRLPSNERQAKPIADG